MNWKIAVVLLAAISVVVLTAEPAFGQGGTGRSNANNSGQPAKKTGRRSSGVISLADTVWQYKDNRGEEYIQEFLSGGKLKYSGDGEGTWRQYGKTVVIDFEGGQEEGTINGNQIRGTGHDSRGSYTWTLRRSQ